MKAGLTLTELAQRIEANRAMKRDYIAPAAELRMHVDDDATASLIVPGHATFPLLPTAHDQLGGYLEIPTKYYRRMQAEAPALLANNVNEWFARSGGDRRMVRTLGGDCRALLSNRYQRIENEEIAQVVLPILGEIPDVQIRSCELTPRRMYIQAVSPRVQGEVRKGDVVQAGVVISNSEIGYGAVMVAAMDYRLVCLNGAISAERFRAYHVGRQVDDNDALWADDTRRADDRAVLLKVRDMVHAAVDAVRFRARIERMRELAGLRSESAAANPARAVEVLAQKVGATETEKGGILRALIEGGDLSAWGFLNAVTAQAHTAADYDRGVELEAAGGQLLDMSQRDWRQVLEAA